MHNSALIADEDFREDCRRAGLEDVHPALRNRYLTRPEKPRCRACGFEPYEDLSEDGLCRECDAVVKELEQGIIR